MKHYQSISQQMLKKAISPQYGYFKDQVGDIMEENAKKLRGPTYNKIPEDEKCWMKERWTWNTLFPQETAAFPGIKPKHKTNAPPAASAPKGFAFNFNNNSPNVAKTKLNVAGRSSLSNGGIDTNQPRKLIEGAKTGKEMHTGEPTAIASSSSRPRADTQFGAPTSADIVALIKSFSHGTPISEGKRKRGDEDIQDNSMKVLAKRPKSGRAPPADYHTVHSATSANFQPSLRLNRLGTPLYSIGNIKYPDASKLFLGSCSTGIAEIQEKFNVRFSQGYFNNELFFYVEPLGVTGKHDQAVQKLCNRALHFLGCYVKYCRAQPTYLDDYFKGDAWQGKLFAKTKSQQKSDGPTFFPQAQALRTVVGHAQPRQSDHSPASSQAAQVQRTYKTDISNPALLSIDHLPLYSVGPITHSDAIELFLGSHRTGYLDVQNFFRVYFFHGHFKGNLLFYVEPPLFAINAKAFSSECKKALGFLKAYVETCAKDNHPQFIDIYLKNSDWLAKVGEQDSVKDQRVTENFSPANHFSPGSSLELQASGRSARLEQSNTLSLPIREEVAGQEMKKEVE